MQLSAKTRLVSKTQSHRDRLNNQKTHNQIPQFLPHDYHEKILAESVTIPPLKDLVSRNENSQITILRWPYYIPEAGQIFSNKVSETASESCGGCLLTNDLSYQNSAEAQFMNTDQLFHYLKSEKNYAPDPKTRNPDQYWIGWWKDSATAGQKHIANLKDLFENVFILKKIIILFCYSELSVANEVAQFCTRKFSGPDPK